MDGDGDIADAIVGVERDGSRGLRAVVARPGGACRVAGRLAEVERERVVDAAP